MVQSNLPSFKPWVQLCPQFFVQCESTRVTTLQSSVHVHQMTLSCSVPPTSTRCHSGGSYELTVPVYKTGGQYLFEMCVVLYTNVHAYWLDFNPDPSYFSSCLGTSSSYYLYKVSESIHCTQNVSVDIDITFNSYCVFEPSAHMCEGYGSSRVCVCLCLCLCATLAASVFTFNQWLTRGKPLHGTNRFT